MAKEKIQNPLTQDQIAQLTALVKSSITSTLQGSEKVNDINCYVVKIEPDIKALWQYLMSQQNNVPSGFDFSQFDLSKIIKDVSLQYWITKKSYQIIKAEAEMNMNIDSETFTILSIRSLKIILVIFFFPI